VPCKKLISSAWFINISLDVQFSVLFFHAFALSHSASNSYRCVYTLILGGFWNDLSSDTQGSQDSEDAYHGH
jgi:hypothetical protein